MIVALPDAAHARHRYVQSAPLQFIGDPHLPPGRLGDLNFHHRLLNRGRHSIAEHRLAPRDLLQRRLAALVVEFLETIEAVAALTRISHRIEAPPVTFC